MHQHVRRFYTNTNNAGNSRTIACGFLNDCLMAAWLASAGCLFLVMARCHFVCVAARAVCMSRPIPAPIARSVVRRELCFEPTRAGRDCHWTIPTRGEPAFLGRGHAPFQAFDVERNDVLAHGSPTSDDDEHDHDGRYGKEREREFEFEAHVQSIRESA